MMLLVLVVMVVVLLVMVIVIDLMVSILNKLHISETLEYLRHARRHCHRIATKSPNSQSG